MVVWLGMLSGCGEPDECANVSCDFGVCEAGQCQNPSSCTVNLDCVPGSICGEESVCKSLSACSADADCATGVCQGSACINPDTCETNADCFERTFCAEDNTCKPDPCNSFQCGVGQCDRGTTECVSKDTCTLETEADDCVNGDKCLDGSCYDEVSYCEALACERGVCSFEERGCVNADNCEGDAANCVEGAYCNDSNECADDLCVVNSIECSEGVCVPSVGQCQNAATCDEPSDCVEGHVCIGDACRLESVACGDDGCPGNQLCDIAEQARSASCIENTTQACTTSLDCRDDRQCAGNACLAPFSCADDRFEPNDTDDNATDFNLFATGVSVDANICSGDTDVYALDLGQYQGLALRGQLVIKAVFATRDIGLGEVELEVFDDGGGATDGTSVGSDTSSAMGQDGELEVVTTLNAASSRKYQVKVSDAGTVGQPGVHYTLSAEYFEAGALKACDSPTALIAGTPVTGDTTQSEAFAFGSSCTGIHNDARDDIYRFELTEPSRVSVNVLPVENDTDFSLSVRTSCKDLASEIACNNTGESGGELLRTLLGPGIYFVQVQTATGAGGQYSLSFQTESRTCAPSSNACTDQSTAQICNEQGMALVETQCSLGCDASTGTCIKAQGDACQNPVLLSDGDSETIVWSDFGDDHELVFNACLNGSNGAHTKGADAVYAVRVGANEGLQAQLELDQGDQGAVYIVETCASMDSTCIGGGDANNGDIEVATYNNTSGRAKTVFVVADSAVGNTGEGLLSVDVSPIICQSGQTRCDGSGNVERCNEIGTAYFTDASCPFGCTTGSCDMDCDSDTDVAFCFDSTTEWVCTANDTWQDNQCAVGCNGTGCTLENCTNPEDVTTTAAVSGGVTITGTWGDFAVDFGGSGCGVDSTDTDGEDVVATATLNAGQEITASLVSSGINADPSLVISPTCGDISSSTCLAGQAEQDATATVSYTASGTETVFIIANSDDSNSSSQAETFDFHLEIQ
jgi:hypothetical protein